MGINYHVAKYGSDKNAGTEIAPFLTIQRAANIAVAGDTVTVHEGEYREWVDPKNSGVDNGNRIIYEAAKGERVVIKGSEIVTDWENVDGTVWKTVISNSIFGDWNPYVRIIEGDWHISPQEYKVHLGDVYINGKSMYEATSKKELFTTPRRINGVNFFRKDSLPFPNDSIYQWLAEVDDQNTTIYGNFHEFDPNCELIEINVRKCCFFPTETGRNYITVRGFEMAHAACPFVPPTSYQWGMLGVNWSKGWIIENNHLHDAKCSAISLGKEKTTGDNLHYQTLRKSGYTYQKEAVFAALRIGWSKENIGSHIVRNNLIHDCGQNGIAGHMGCAFSLIEHNHIYNISTKQEFYGHELGGIKFHAPIDTVIQDNNIHNCSTFGIWLDWQAQGTRVTKNLFSKNGNDLKIEVTHGPCSVDNNVFMSEFNLVDAAQGTAYVHNIFTGNVNHYKIKNRSTPYHFPHTTEVMGCEMVYGGDDRFMNNMFMGLDKKDWGFLCNFTEKYNEYCLPEEYIGLVKATGFGTDHEECDEVPQPIVIEGNVYSGVAVPHRAEKGHITVSDLTCELKENNGEWALEINVPEEVTKMNCRPVTTECLGSPRITEAPYVNPDGTPIDFTVDLVGNTRNGNVIAGPFVALKPGKQIITVWKE